MAEEFQKAVAEGLKLAKRVYFGKDSNIAPPKLQPAMERSPHWCLPTAPMVYAVITDPGIVDNPDIPSYQPYVHGRCDPPALIPLQMNGIELEVDCYMDTAFIRVSGSWRVHCVMGSRVCDCRITVPMGEQGSILGVEIEHRTKTYSTELIPASETEGIHVATRSEGGFLLPHIFTLTVPQIDGGSNLSIKLQWSQKLSYNDRQFTLSVPFTFPRYVTPAVKKIPKKQRVQLNINSGAHAEIICGTNSHPLKETHREAGKLGFNYEAQVLSWSKTDFNFSYKISSSHISGGILLQSPPPYDIDQREIFCLYLLPGEQQSKKVFKKDVIFVVDISGSMEGKPLEATRTAISAALLKLSPTDSFNIMAFNNNLYSFSTSLENATVEAIEKANQWLDMNLIAEGGTEISLSLNKAITMLSDTKSSIPTIFFITDGSVEDERQICHSIINQIKEKASLFPRIYTFGIGSFCNHYFLHKLATITRGQRDSAHHLDFIEPRLQKLFSRGLSATLADVTIDSLDDLNMEVYPSCIPDLSSEHPLTICGRYEGRFPDTIKIRGLLGDSSSFVKDLNVQRVKIPLERILAKQHIDLHTAQAWLSEDKQLEEKVSKMSVHTGVISEYTRMIVTESSRSPQGGDSSGVSKGGVKKAETKKIADPKSPKKTLLPNLSLGFGDVNATVENTRPGCESCEDGKLPEAAEIFVKATSDCFGKLCNQCCCMCCIGCCSRMNDQCAVVLTQLCTALACFGCFECCTLCCGGEMK